MPDKELKKVGKSIKKAMILKVEEVVYFFLAFVFYDSHKEISVKYNLACPLFADRNASN